MNLFKYLLEHSFTAIGPVVDWWLMEGKFDGWEKQDVTGFTKKLHTISGFSKDRDLHYERGLNFPKKAARYPQIWMTPGDSEGRDWIRHIRNGIAHGNVTVRTLQGEPILEIRDYQADGKTQTAYLLIPLNYLISIKKAYTKAK